MWRSVRPLLWTALALWIATRAATAQVDCSAFQIDPVASVPITAPAGPPPQFCRTGLSDGFPVPDPNCTPGAANPTITVDVLRDPRFRTRCVRQHATTEQQKATTYALYGVSHPANNFGPNQTCELDHLIPLELGGADTLDNIWPQCGPAGVALLDRYFKEKDEVENYLAMMVKTGQIDLAAAQRGIATNWPQYLAAARQACPAGRC